MSEPTLTQFWLDKIKAEWQAEAVAAERARIRAAVPRCDCPEHGHYEGCCRAAVLRIIDGEGA